MGCNCFRASDSNNLDTEKKENRYNKDVIKIKIG